MAIDFEEWHELSEAEKIYFPILCAALLALSGTCSGLTIGIFSIDLIDMQVLKNTGDAVGRKRGRRIVPLLENANQTLVTLLVANTMCMTALPIMLERMVGPLLALVMAVTLLLFFGEVLPQATFVRHNVAVCAALAPFVYAAGIITFPITFPLAKVLDKAVGTPDTAVTREYVRGAVTRAIEAVGDGGCEGLAPHEVRVMRGAMQLSERCIGQLPVVPVDQAFMLEATEVLTPELTARIVSEGYSRIPVYLGNRKHVIGVLIVKALIALAFRGDRKWTILELPLIEPMRVAADARVLDLYQSFKKGQSHLATVYDRLGLLVGFVTLEDVFELVHECAIRDEADREDDELAVSDPTAALGDTRRAGTQLHHSAHRSEMSEQQRRRDQLLVSVYESVRASQRATVARGTPALASG
eukprot:CAMPEP_0174845258 /NCGR_PEP_ID=MMETSP1114-20130205/11618_1 /TAXON_ID=312471 /ORGANISM="Neobodo designis, Strain CCAP 1951/1" /LENGTH=413 /DNA_ID=CAMNT_0016079505 /DNA_START=36 /DNA_END=1275 /DNA_ORIENTATION=-